MIGLDEAAKVAQISEVYSDSLKCQSGCIVIDNIIDLIQYVPMDRHYSKAILQRFAEFLRKQPEKGKKTILIVTETRK